MSGLTKLHLTPPLLSGFTKITFHLYEKRLDWGQKKLMLLCAVVPSLMQDCYCGVTCIVQCTQLIERTLVVNLLGIWKVTQVLQQYSQWWRISLQPSSSHTHRQTHMFTCPSPACDYSPSLTRSCPHSWLDPTAVSVVAPSLHDRTGLCHRKDCASADKLHPGLLSF